MGNKLLVAGTAAYDTLETPHGKRERVLGGSAVYASLAARYFASPCILSTVGEDFLEKDEKLLGVSGIDTRSLWKKKGEKTFFWEGSYVNDLNSASTLKTELNVLLNFDTKVHEAHREAEYLFLANIDPLLQKHVLGQLGSLKFSGLDTMNFWIESKPEAVLELFPMIGILFINEGELRGLSGQNNIWKGAEVLLSKGLKRLVVKRGEYGAVLFAEGKIFIVPAFPTKEVVDPTGAGDSFAGGFLGHVASRGSWGFEDLRDALLWGAVIASFTVSDFSVGALLGADRKRVEDRADEFRGLIGIK